MRMRDSGRTFEVECDVGVRLSGGRLGDDLVLSAVVLRDAADGQRQDVVDAVGVRHGAVAAAVADRRRAAVPLDRRRRARRQPDLELDRPVAGLVDRRRRGERRRHRRRSLRCITNTRTHMQSISQSITHT